MISNSDNCKLTPAVSEEDSLSRESDYLYTFPSLSFTGLSLEQTKHFVDQARELLAQPLHLEEIAENTHRQQAPKEFPRGFNISPLVYPLAPDDPRNDIVWLPPARLAPQ